MGFFQQSIVCLVDIKLSLGKEQGGAELVLRVTASFDIRSAANTMAIYCSF